MHPQWRRGLVGQRLPSSELGVAGPRRACRSVPVDRAAGHENRAPTSTVPMTGSGSRVGVTGRYDSTHFGPTTTKIANPQAACRIEVSWLQVVAGSAAGSRRPRSLRRHQMFGAHGHSEIGSQPRTGLARRTGAMRQVTGSLLNGTAVSLTRAASMCARDIAPAGCVQIRLFDGD
jgi:hypothetical protein